MVETSNKERVKVNRKMKRLNRKIERLRLETSEFIAEYKDLDFDLDVRIENYDGFYSEITLNSRLLTENLTFFQ